MADHGIGRIDRRGFLGAVLVTAAGGPSLLAQTPRPNERLVDPISLALDKPNVWTLYFRYKAPRIVPVDSLDRNNKPAQKLCWYMWFQVYHYYDDPVVCLPEFELVPKDLKVPPLLDEPEPFVVDQLRKVEDKENILNIQTTISISKRPIPPSKKDAFPKYTTGIATWLDMADKAPKTNKFSVYIMGLSNGLAAEQTPTGQTIVRRKTLRIDFFRPTDDKNPNATDIRADDENGPPETWLYHLPPKPEEKK